jgi:hypothetical protein
VRYADVDSPEVPAGPIDTLQFFEVKISEISGLKWPLQVYGFVAARDMVDYKRNMIFERERDNCQIISEEVRIVALLTPCLYLDNYYCLVWSSAESSYLTDSIVVDLSLNTFVALTIMASSNPHSNPDILACKIQGTNFMRRLTKL